MLASTEVVDVETLHDRVRAVGTGDRERRDDALQPRRSCRRTGWPCSPSRPRACREPSRACGRSPRWRPRPPTTRPAPSMIAAPRFCTVGMKVVLDPVVVVDGVGGTAAMDLGVEDVRVLGRRVVSPDGHGGDVVHCRAHLVRHLGDRPVVIEPGHRRELTRIEIGGRRLGDQRIGVGRVADNQHLDRRGSHCR